MRPRLILRFVASLALLLTSSCSLLTKPDEIHVIRESESPELIELPNNLIANPQGRQQFQKMAPPSNMGCGG